MDSWLLSESRFRDIRAGDFEVAVLPFGATEPHNLHLPYGTDALIVEALGRAVCGEAARKGAKVVLLPTIPYGTQTMMQCLPLAMNVNPSTLMLVVRDLADSLIRSGIKKIVLLNAHGGNELKSIVRELSGQFDATFFSCSWWDVVADDYHDIFAEREDHAGEAETSMGLALFPELIGTKDDGTLDADDGVVRQFRFEAMRQGWVKTSRPWHLLTTNTGSGNPHLATDEKGKRLIELLVDRLAPFLVQLSNETIDGTFPFE